MAQAQSVGDQCAALKTCRQPVKLGSRGEQCMTWLLVQKKRGGSLAQQAAVPLASTGIEPDLQNKNHITEAGSYPRPHGFRKQFALRKASVVTSLPGVSGGVTAMGTDNAELIFPLNITDGLIWPFIVKRACLNVAE